MDKDKTDFFRDRLNGGLNGFKGGRDKTPEQPNTQSGRTDIEDGFKSIGKLFLFLSRIFGFWGGQYFIITKFFPAIEPYGFIESLVIYMGLYAVVNLKARNNK